MAMTIDGGESMYRPRRQPTAPDLDLGPLVGLLQYACGYYEASAPTVSDYCDNLYRRINERPKDVSLLEVLRASSLRDESGMMPPNLAANIIYKLQHEMGQDVIGHAGF